MYTRIEIVDRLENADFEVTLTVELDETVEEPYYFNLSGDTIWLSEKDVNTIIKLLQVAKKARKTKSLVHIKE